jgi:hypothetical protein
MGIFVVNSEERKMKNYKLILLFTLLVFSACYVAQQEPIINPNEQSKVLERSVEEYNDKNGAMLYGEIIDIKTKEVIPYVPIELKSLTKIYYTSSDDKGKFQIIINKKLYLTYKATFSYPGYRKISVDNLQFENGKAINLKIGMFAPELMFD